jgi:hypothetical protein
MHDLHDLGEQCTVWRPALTGPGCVSTPTQAVDIPSLVVNFSAITVSTWVLMDQGNGGMRVGFDVPPLLRFARMFGWRGRR